MLLEVQGMHFYGILWNNSWIIASKEGRLPYPKEIHAIMNMHVPQNS
jgi:hypothetical protein